MNINLSHKIKICFHRKNKKDTIIMTVIMKRKIKYRKNKRIHNKDKNTMNTFTMLTSYLKTTLNYNHNRSHNHRTSTKIKIKIKNNCLPNCLSL